MSIYLHSSLKRFKDGWLPFLAFFLLLILVSVLSTKFSDSCATNSLNDSMKKATNKVPIRPAQSAKLCYDRSSRLSASEALLSKLLVRRDISQVDKSILELQFVHGLRVSEVLGIRVVDLLSLHRIRINSKKGSISRVIVHVDSSGYLDKCRRIGMSPYSLYSRFYVYRLYKRLGISYTKPGAKHSAVTHAPRHWAAHEIVQLDKSKELGSDFLRHKSGRSIESYV